MFFQKFFKKFPSKKRFLGNAFFAAAAILSFAGTTFAQDFVSKSGNVLEIPFEDKSLNFSSLELAKLALKSGQNNLALSFANEILADENAVPEVRNSALFLAATAEISLGKFSDAEEKLEILGNDSVEKKLRWALVKIGERDFYSAEKFLSEIDDESLSNADSAWFFAAKGIVEAKKIGAEAEENSDEIFSQDALAGTFFSTARERAESASQFAEFEFLQAFAYAIFGGNPSEEKIEEFREKVISDEENSARWTKLLAMSLAAKGDFEEARAALGNAKNASAQERAEFDLLQGIFQNDLKSSAARRAFLRVLKARPKRVLQEIALAGIWLGIEEIAAVPENLEQVILAANEVEFFFEALENEKNLGNEVADLELLFRAKIAILAGNSAVAEKLVNSILEKFPTSSLVPEALRISAWAAIKKGEFRKAAPLIERLSELESDPEEKANLNVRLGECYFESGDYSLAANVYAKIDGKIFGENYAGYLIFQEIFSEICAGNLDQAAELLDKTHAEFESDEARGNAENSEIINWLSRAECSLIFALRKASPARLKDAAERCKNFLAKKNVLTPFRIYALWQQAVLAVEMNDAEMILKTADDFSDEVGKISDRDFSEIGWEKEKLLSNVSLLKIRGFSMLGNDAEGKSELENLRSNFSGTTAEIVSFLEEGRAFADKKQPTAALLCYEKLIERCGENPEFSEYVAKAYFEAAQQFAALGRFRDAISFLDTLATRFPDSPLAFYARLQQADFFRILNEFDSALAVYEKLKIAFPHRQDLRRVEISRADCLLALAATSRPENAAGTTNLAIANAAKTNLEAAIFAYERLFSLPDVPFDLMAEAGNKWAYATAQTAKILEKVAPEARERYFDEAKKIHWKVVNEVFSKATKDSEDPAAVWGARTGYWIARSLFAIAEIAEQQNDFDEAKKVYDLVENWSSKNWIPGAEYARSRKAAIQGK